jgi:hypothetical protein
LSVGLIPPEAWNKILYFASWSGGSPIPVFMSASSLLSPSSHSFLFPVFLLCVSLIRTLISDAHLENPGWSYLKILNYICKGPFSK